MHREYFTAWKRLRPLLEKSIVLTATRLSFGLVPQGCICQAKSAIVRVDSPLHPEHSAPALMDRI